MKPRLLVIIGICLLLLAVAWIAFHRDREDSAPPGTSSPTANKADTTSPNSTTDSAAVPAAIPPAPSTSGVAPALPRVPAPQQIPSSNPTKAGTPSSLTERPRTDQAPPLVVAPPPSGANAVAMQDLDKVSRMLRDYRTAMGENPVGTNAEIMRAIMGGNPKKANLGPPEGMSLNGNGELVDSWGTPIFFHQLSGTHMEIRSAGPDQVMWTGDDVIWK